ncbi:NAD(P)-binding domain-containing protein [Streptomyces sp. NPDC003077]|uniref:NAD(P)-dependent oxidoreductase n=1 Tax=Streptomyces sp. NPDC003077 TaxID=3154443 RepID=UPI0033AFF4C5
MTNANNDNSNSPVTVIGLGPMGQALAGAFLANGHPTTVWNRSAGKGAELVEKGAVRAGSVADAVAASPLIILCVLNYDAVRAILEPVAENLKGKTVVNLTADTPERSREVAAWASVKGIDYLDGSIMTPTVTIGSPAASILYSGPEEVFRAHQPALASLGGAATHLGTDPGRAAAFDVALLDIYWTAMSGYVHALALARAEGITATDLLPHAKGVVGIIPDIMAVLASQVDERRYPGDQSSIRSNAASMDHIMHAAEGRGLDVGMLKAAKATAQRAIDAGRGGDGFSLLVDVLSGEDIAE